MREESRKVSFKVLPWIVFGTLVIVCLLGNIFIPGLIWTNRRIGGPTEYLGFFAFGFVIAQIGALALWNAIGPQALRWRLPTSLLLALLAGASYVLGLQVADWMDSRMSAVSVSTALAIIAIALGSLLVASAVLSVIMRLLGTKLVTQHEAVEESKSKRFSITYLIGITTVVALAVTALRAVMPMVDDTNMPYGLVFIALCTLQTVVYCCLLIMGIAQLFLLPEGNMIGVATMFAVFFVGMPLNMYLLSFHRLFRFDGEVFSMYTAMIVGFIIAMCLFNALLRASGYKLVPR
ncbi:MAG: hypothetical protein AAF483_03695 [Planctomycetota bacterium]